MNRKIIFLILFYSFWMTGSAQQNLVPNPGFENYTSCPTNSGQLSLAPPWIAVQANNVEYFNSCAIPCNGVSVPCQNSGSFQYAKTGNAMAGFWMLNGYGVNYREYLQVQLLDTLSSINCYQVCFHVNLFNTIGLATNNFGVYFSNNSFSTSGGPAPYVPQILSNILVSDTLNWIKIEGILEATGDELFLTIGNFYDDLNTDTINTGFGTYNGAYYFIDDVSVIPIDSIPGGLPAFAGNDTLIMQGDSIFIGQEISNLNCNWYDEDGTLIASGISGIFVQPDSTTLYVVEQNLCGNVSYDTVVVSVSPVGVEEFEIKNLKFEIYPNPAKEKLFIETDIVNGTLQITDVTGKIIKEIKLTQPKTEIQAELLSNGTYFVSIMSEKKIFKTKRIVIAK